jgi:hypothetical protein
MIGPLAGLVLSAALAATPSAPAAAPAGVVEVCSNDAFTVDGHALAIQLCAPSAAPRAEKGKRTMLIVRETLSSGGVTFVHSATFAYTEGSEMSRTLDDVPLDRLGIPKTVHLTIGYTPGSVKLEHVLLVPGAVPLK